MLGFKRRTDPSSSNNYKKNKKNHHKTPLSFLGHSLKSQNKSGPMNGGRSPRLSPLESRKTTHDFFFSSDQEVSDIMTSSFQQMFLQKQRRVQTAAAACIRFPFTTTVHLNTNTVWNLSYDKQQKEETRKCCSDLTAGCVFFLKLHVQRCSKEESTDHNSLRSFLLCNK